MIYSLRGKLIEKTSDYLVVECGGVGYLCKSSLNTIANSPEIDNDIFLYTELNVYQDGVCLYGFFDKSEKSCFDMLCSVSGVGPKAALSILSSLDPAQFAIKVASGDSKALTVAKGVGKKMADRIILELREKVSKLGIDLKEGNISEIGTTEGMAAYDDAIAALTVLGYTEGEIRPYISKIDPSLDTSGIIKEVLKMIGKRKGRR